MNLISYSLPPKVVGLIGLMGKKWRIEILFQLLQNSLSFAEIKANINGISNSVLSETLRVFIEYNLVEKRRVPSVPNKYNYVITSSSSELIRVIFIKIIGWQAGREPKKIPTTRTF